jgi:hypothetical protein
VSVVNSFLSKNIATLETVLYACIVQFRILTVSIIEELNMADEKPVTLSKKRIVSSTCADSQLVCIVHYQNCFDNEIIAISDSQFSTIQTSAAIRQVQQAEGPRLDDIICAGIPSQLLQSCHGIHRQCYKKFDQ